MTFSRETPTLLPAYFGEFGGQFVPESLIPALDQLEKAFVDAQNDPSFRAELKGYLKDYLGRKVKVDSKGKKGTLQIEFYGEDDLAALMEKLNLNR